jgi:type IV pilus assembly protein PilM
MFLSNPFPGAFGLYIDDLSLTLLQLNHHSPLFGKEYFSVANLRTTTLPPGCIVNGEIEQPEVVRRKILHLLGEDGAYKKIKSPWVVANIPEPKTFITLITIPGSDKEITTDDIHYHASKHLPFSEDEAYFDWQMITTSEKETQFLLTSVTKIASDSYTYLLEAAGLNPLALDMEAAALTRVLITEDKDYTGQARALFHLGYDRSSLVVYDHDTIQFSASLPFSLSLLTTAVSQGLKITHDEALSFIKEQGCVHSKKYPKYINVVDGMLKRLVDDIQNAITFYQDHFSSTNTISHGTMAGPAAGLANLDLILSQKLKISTHPGHIWKNVTYKNTPVKDSDLSLALPLGLALRAAHNPLHDDGV